MKKYLLTVAAIILTVSVVLLFFYQKNTCDGCDSCRYKKFTDLVKIDRIDRDENSIHEIQLHSTLHTNNVYQLDAGFLNRIQTNMDKTILSDTSNRYTISEEKIYSGTCAPYAIESMLLYKK